MEKNAVTVALGSYHTCAIDNTGSLYCWGSNNFGQLGDGTNKQKQWPTLITLDDGVTVGQVVGGYKYTYVFNHDGNTICWGHNNFGQLGDGTNTDTPFVETSDQPSKIPTVKPTNHISEKPSLETSDEPPKTLTQKPTNQSSDQPSSGPSDKTYKLRLSVCGV